MPASLILSVALHLAVLIVAVVGLPQLARDAAAPPNVIPVQVVTVGERTTAPPPAEEVQPKEVEESPAEPEAAEAKETAAAEPAEAAAESPSPPPLPAEAAEQAAPPEPPPPPAPPEQDLAALAPPVPSEPETAVAPPEPVKVQPAPEPGPEKPEPAKEAVVPQPATSTTSTRSKPPKPPPLPKAKPDRPEPLQAEPKPETPKPEQPKREVAKNAEPKREPAKNAEPKRDEFAALESLVENMKKSSPVAEKPEKPEKRPAKPPQDELASISSALQPASSRSITSSNLTISEIDALRRQLEGCWIVPVGAKDAEDLSVEIRVRLDQHGMVKSADIVDGARMARDPFFRAAAESAQRAVYKCSPLKVPKDKYSEWQDMTLTFDPKDFVS